MSEQPTSSLFPLGLKSGTFIEAPLQKVHQCLLYWASGNPADCDIRGQRLNQPFSAAIQHLDPRFFNPDRALLARHSSGWTAFFDNHSRHFSPAAELFVLCQRLKTRTCFFFHEHDGEDPGSSVFSHNECVPPATVKERFLWLAREPRWKFRPSGDPLPFEKLDAYSAPQVKDRLTPSLLREYGEALGIRFWDLSTYSSETVLLGWRSKVPGQREHGLEHPVATAR